MLRNFAAALLATTLIAGPAFAVEPSGNASSPAPSATVRTDAKATVKAAAPSVEPAKHLASMCAATPASTWRTVASTGRRQCIISRAARRTRRTSPP